MFFHSKDEHDIPKKGALNALAAYAYIGAVALFMVTLERHFSGPDGDGILAPMGFLSMLVLSASVMGSLFFGAPVMLYVDGKKKDAVRLLGWTVGSFAAITFCTFLVVMLTSAR